MELPAADSYITGRDRSNVITSEQKQGERSNTALHTATGDDYRRTVQIPKILASAFPPRKRR